MDETNESSPFEACLIAFPVMLVGGGIIDYSATQEGGFWSLAKVYGLFLVALAFVILWIGTREEPEAKEEDELDDEALNLTI